MGYEKGTVNQPLGSTLHCLLYTLAEHTKVKFLCLRELFLILLYYNCAKYNIIHSISRIQQEQCSLRKLCGLRKQEAAKSHYVR